MFARCRLPPQPVSYIGFGDAVSEDDRLTALPTFECLQLGLPLTELEGGGILVALCRPEDGFVLEIERLRYV